MKTFSQARSLALLLLLAVALAFECTAVIHAAPLAGGSVRLTGGSAATTGACAFSREDIRSMHAVYLREAGIWVARTSDGFAGYDGGALEILNCPALQK